MTDIKAIALRAPRRLSIAVAAVIIGIGVFMSVRTLLIMLDVAATGVPHDGGILAPLVSILPPGTRALAALAVWLLVIATTVPMLARNSAFVGAIAAHAETDHLAVWVPLSWRWRRSSGLRVQRGETLVVTHRASKQGLFNQNEKNSVKLSGAQTSLTTMLDVAPDQYTAAGLRECAKAAGVRLEFRDTAKGFDLTPR